MKKLFICLCAGLLSLGASYAQKKPLDEEAYKKWLTLSQQQMSNDGQWVTYRHANHDSLRVLYLYGNGHTSLFADMMDAIEHDRKPYVDAVAGRNALEMVLAIYKSQKTGMPVKLPLDDFASIDMMGEF